MSREHYRHIQYFSQSNNNLQINKNLILITTRLRPVASLNAAVHIAYVLPQLRVWHTWCYFQRRWSVKRALFKLISSWNCEQNLVRTRLGLQHKLAWRSNQVKRKTPSWYRRLWFYAQHTLLSSISTPLSSTWKVSWCVCRAAAPTDRNEFTAKY